MAGLIDWRVLRQAHVTQASSAICTFYVLDLSRIGGPVLRFHDMGSGDYIRWQGQNYQPMPIQIEGFEFSSAGTQPRPTMRCSNITGAFMILCRDFNDLIGGVLIRKRTFESYLDGKPLYDPDVHLPDDIWYIIQKSNENNQMVEFQLGTAMDVEGVQLPGRTCLAGTCTWHYRANGCGFAENRAVATVDDVGIPTTQVYRGRWGAGVAYAVGNVVYLSAVSRNQYYYCKVAHTSVGERPPSHEPGLWTADECSKNLKGCSLRFQAASHMGLPFGAFPGIARLPIQGA
jgi:lambda family phage minor tail protein L